MKRILINDVMVKFTEKVQLKSLKELDKLSPGRKVVIKLDPDNKKTLGALIFSGPVNYLRGRQYEVREAQLKFLDREGVRYTVLKDYGREK